MLGKAFSKMDGNSPRPAAGSGGGASPAFTDSELSLEELKGGAPMEQEVNFSWAVFIFRFVHNNGSPSLNMDTLK